jgi:hypothetical protein
MGDRRAATEELLLKPDWKECYVISCIEYGTWRLLRTRRVALFPNDTGATGSVAPNSRQRIWPQTIGRSKSRKNAGRDMKSSETAFALGTTTEFQVFCSAALTPIFELNLFLLDTLVQIACDSVPEQTPQLVSALRSSLSQLTMRARSTLARSPIALLDAGFTDEGRWAAAIAQPERDFPERTEMFPYLHATQLAHQTLTLAWTTARASIQGACIVFGMTQKCAYALSRAGMHTIQRIAETHSNWVRPVWEGHPEIWGRLLSMATAPQPKLPSVGIRVLQQRMADLEPATYASDEIRSSRS